MCIKGLICVKYSYACVKNTDVSTCFQDCLKYLEGHTEK